MTAPRYVQMASTLRAAIRRGTFPIGSYLPTEHELCAQHSVSRHTAREALRVLLDEGLIERRRGAGTIVTQPPATPAFSQPLDGVEDLLQYAQDARLSVLETGPLDTDSPLRIGLRLPGDAAFTLVSGIRIASGQPPLALTHIAVRADLVPPRPTLDTLDGAITEWITKTHGVAFEGIQQEISADLVDDRTAEAIKASPGAPALRTRRWYMVENDQIAVASDTIHAADRFIYRMTLKRLAGTKAS